MTRLANGVPVATVERQEAHTQCNVIISYSHTLMPCSALSVSLERYRIEPPHLVSSHRQQHHVQQHVPHSPNKFQKRQQGPCRCGPGSRDGDGDDLLTVLLGAEGPLYSSRYTTVLLSTPSRVGPRAAGVLSGCDIGSKGMPGRS